TLTKVTDRPRWKLGQSAPHGNPTVHPGPSASVAFWRKTMARSDVLIAGAGPTGLVLALWLTKLGGKIRIIDKAAEPGTTSGALLVHARTLELYRQLGLADTVVARGHKVPAVRFWVKSKPEARISFEEVGTDLTPYSFLVIFPQDE